MVPKCSLSFDRGVVDEVEEGGVKVFYDRIFLNNRYFCRRESPLRCKGGEGGGEDKDNRSQ